MQGKNRAPGCGIVICLSSTSRIPLTPAQRWATVILLGLGVLIAYVDRTNFSVALVVKDFKALFQLTDVNRGTLNSAFFWSYAFLQIPAGYAVDRWGVKYPYAVGFVFWSIVSAATALAGSFYQLIGLRILLGVGEAIVTPASMRWLKLNVDESQRGLATGIYMSGTKYGPAVGNAVAPMLIREYDWRVMFLILGLGALVWLIPWLYFLRDDDKELAAGQAKRDSGPSASFADVMASPLMWGVLIGTFAYNYFTYFAQTWMPAYFVEQRGFDLTKMGWFQFAGFFGMATMAIVAGWAADRFIAAGRDAVAVRKAFTIAGLCCASTEIFGALSSSRDVAVFFSIVSLTGLGLATANYWALTQTLMPSSSIGRVTGLQNFASNLGGIVAPLLTGWLKQVTGSYVAPMVLICVLLVIGILAYTFLVTPRFAPRKSNV